MLSALLALLQQRVRIWSTTITSPQIDVLKILNNIEIFISSFVFYQIKKVITFLLEFQRLLIFK